MSDKDQHKDAQPASSWHFYVRNNSSEISAILLKQRKKCWRKQQQEFFTVFNSSISYSFICFSDSSLSSPADWNCEHPGK